MDQNDQLIKLPKELNDSQTALVTGITPPKYIKTRPGAGGKQFSYVTTGYVLELLNKAFGFNWDFRVTDQGINADESKVWVRGELTVRTATATITKSQFGSGDSSYMSVGDNLKSASSDCLKKCASLLGVASDVYFPKEGE